MKQLSFDYFKGQNKVVNENKLFTLLTGIRGAGKSTVIGTLGVRTFLLATTLESHAVTASKIFGGNNIISTLFDTDEDNKQMKPDAALTNLHAILDFLINSPDLLNNIDCVALDSVSAVDKILIETSRILQEKNGFEQLKILEQEHLKIIRKLKELHRKGLHVIATMPILATFDENGFYATAKAEIRGVTTTSNIAGNFDDILVIAKPEKDYIFQMDLMIKKVGKDMTGLEKSVVFRPRITGLSEQDLLHISPDLVLPADLSYIYQLKVAKQGS